MRSHPRPRAAHPPRPSLPGWRLLLCALVLLAQSAQAQRPAYLPPPHLALVIGISAYTDWPAIPTAADEARRIAGLLEQGGFATQLAIDPDATALKSAWDRFAAAAARRPDSACIVYFRGHARTLSMENGARKGWLLPADASREAPTRRALPVAALMAAGERPEVRHLLFLCDAPLEDDTLTEARPVLRLPGLQDGDPTRQILVAGEAQEAPITGPSPFNAALAQALGGEADVVADGQISTTELAVYLQHRAAGASGGLRPHYALAGDGAEAGGNFTFGTITAKRTTARLFVDALPAEARIRILNIQPKFSQGITLAPGRYHLDVTAAGHRRHRAWIDLDTATDTTIQVRLDKIKPQFTNALGMVFQYVRPGSFEMGTRADAAMPQQMERRHRVTLTRPFYMLKNEVTIGQFRRFSEASGYRAQAEKQGGCWTSGDGRRWRKAADRSWASADKAADDLPVSCVSWQDASAFAAWLSDTEGRTYRLPTEAEWEYACRAGTTTAFAFGDCLSMERANYRTVGPMAASCPPGTETARSRLMAVDSLGANAWGLHHMHGNVAEWCLDFYAPYPQKAVIDPRGPASGVEKVIRGGHYLSRMADCRSAKRSSFPPAYASSAVGFRLVALSE